MRLEGSCHCRKTAGGGYAINLGASTHSMKVTGKRYLGIYRARAQEDGEAKPHLSEARRYFRSRCDSA